MPTSKEEVFGNVSDCKGMGTFSGDHCCDIPEEAKNRIPHYHDVEQADPSSMEPDEVPVTEGELSSHF